MVNSLAKSDGTAGMPKPGMGGKLPVAAGAIVEVFKSFGARSAAPLAGAHVQAQNAWRSARVSCRIVVAISSIDLVVVESQRMPPRRIMASASLTSWRQFSRLA